MWLLDHNIPHKVRQVLEKFGIQAETAVYRGWEGLENGELVSTAVEAGFTVILSRDKQFQSSAKKNIINYPKLALVLILIDQSNAGAYCQDFENAWKKNPIKPIPGQLIEWPK